MTKLNTIFKTRKEQLKFKSLVKNTVTKKTDTTKTDDLKEDKTNISTDTSSNQTNNKTTETTSSPNQQRTETPKAKKCFQGVDYNHKNKPDKFQEDIKEVEIYTKYNL